MSKAQYENFTEGVGYHFEAGGFWINNSMGEYPSVEIPKEETRKLYEVMKEYL